MIAKRPGLKARGSGTGRPIMVLLDILGEKWTLRILWELGTNRASFRELRDRCDLLSPTLLNKRLKSLRDNGLVDLDDNGYGLTKNGRELADELLRLDGWARKWAASVQKNRDAGPSTFS